jgi:hypothetical protein
VLVTNPVNVVVAVEPEIPPGFSTQFPDGNPLKVTLPVAVEQVGCVIILTIGAAIDPTFKVTVSEILAIHEAGFVAVSVKVTEPDAPTPTV